MPTCTPTGSPSRDPLQLVTGMSIAWGASAESVEAACGVELVIDNSPCLAQLVDIRSYAGPAGIAQSELNLTYARNGDGLFEVFVTTDREQALVVDDIRAQLGEPEYTARGARWTIGETRLAVSTARGHTAIRVYDMPRQERYAQAAAQCH
jgi:hypothetical protein